MTNWDDYRFFVVLAQTGSVRASAERLGVNPSTVTRRLDGLEARLGSRLFVRSHTGLTLTADGGQLHERLAPLAADLGDIETMLMSSGDEVAGTIRLAMPDVLAIVLMPALAEYVRAYPRVRLELISDYREMNLARGEADLAVRVTDHPPEDLIGRQLGESRLGVYGSRDYLARHDPIREPEACRWIESGIENVRAPGFKNRYFARVPSGLRCNSVLLQQAAVAEGMGITLLPCAVGDGDGRLARVGALEALEAQPIWLLFPPELRGVARIRSLASHLRAVFTPLEPSLLGVAADSPQTEPTSHDHTTEEAGT